MCLVIKSFRQECLVHTGIGPINVNVTGGFIGYGFSIAIILLKSLECIHNRAWVQDSIALLLLLLFVFLAIFFFILTYYRLDFMPSHLLKSGYEKTQNEAYNMLNKGTKDSYNVCAVLGPHGMSKSSILYCCSQNSWPDLLLWVVIMLSCLVLRADKGWARKGICRQRLSQLTCYPTNVVGGCPLKWTNDWHLGFPPTLRKTIGQPPVVLCKSCVPVRLNVKMSTFSAHKGRVV